MISSLGSFIVDVWCADLSQGNDDTIAFLTPDECHRTKLFAREADRVRWARARGILRAVLARYTGIEPGAHRFSTKPHGKPWLIEGPPDLHFNLAHSGDVAVYALALSSAVGIDVEVAGRKIDHLAVGARVFSSEVLARVKGFDGHDREMEFLRAWVRHEAALKCVGSGFAGAENEPATYPLWVADLDTWPWKKGAAAVACGEKPHEVRCWGWPAAFLGAWQTGNAIAGQSLPIRN